MNLMEDCYYVYCLLDCERLDGVAIRRSFMARIPEIVLFGVGCGVINVHVRHVQLPNDHLILRVTPLQCRSTTSGNSRLAFPPI